MTQSTRRKQRPCEPSESDQSGDELERPANADATPRPTVGNPAAPGATRASISLALDRGLSQPDSTGVGEQPEHCSSCGASEVGGEATMPTFPREPRRDGEATVRPSLKLVTTPPTSDEQTYELRLTYRELALIYKSLQATKILGALPPQNELLNDTIQIVDLAMTRAV
jgi:hypothetical protein